MIYLFIKYNICISDVQIAYISEHFKRNISYILFCVVSLTLFVSACEKNALDKNDDDKDIDDILNLIPKDATYYFTKANIPRALDQNVLAEKAKGFGLNGKTYQTVSLALESAKVNSNKNDLIFVGGSTFVVAEVV